MGTGAAIAAGGSLFGLSVGASFGVGMAITVGAGLWNIPKGAVPGMLNLSTKMFLNTVIGNGLKMPVDAVYAAILGEECGWISGIKTIMDWIF